VNRDITGEADQKSKFVCGHGDCVSFYLYDPIIRTNVTDRRQTTDG